MQASISQLSMYGRKIIIHSNHVWDFRALLTDYLSLKAGYAHMNQYIHLLSNNSISTPTDRVPATQLIDPDEVDQYAFGIFLQPEKSARSFPRRVLQVHVIT